MVIVMTMLGLWLRRASAIELRHWSGRRASPTGFLLLSLLLRFPFLLGALHPPLTFPLPRSIPSLSSPRLPRIIGKEASPDRKARGSLALGYSLGVADASWPHGWAGTQREAETSATEDQAHQRPGTAAAKAGKLSAGARARGGSSAGASALGAATAPPAPRGAASSAEASALRCGGGNAGSWKCPGEESMVELLVLQGGDYVSPEAQERLFKFLL